MSQPDWTTEALPGARLESVDRELMESSERLHRFFTASFRAADIALALPMFNDCTPDTEIAAAMQRRNYSIAGITSDGVAVSFLQHGLSESSGNDLTRHTLAPDQIIHSDTPLSIVVQRLDTHTPLFVSTYGNVSGVIRRECLHKPPGRMWLFGIITLLEMRASIGVDILYPGESWRGIMSAGRLEKALLLQQERERCGHQCALMDCLQLTDKTDLLGRHEKCHELFGVPSRRQFKDAIKGIVALRNNLAHAQDFIPHDWPVILMLAQTLEERLLAPRLPQLLDDTHSSILEAPGEK